MSRIAFVALLAACLMGTAMAGTCQWVDGDCKPDPTAFKTAPRGSAVNWAALLRGFAACKTRAGAACAGTCTLMPGKGCTLTPAARRAFLGTLGPRFAACSKLAPAACAKNIECKVGVGNTCVIAAPGIINTFSLTTNLPSAIPILQDCKTKVTNPKACDA